MPPKLTVIKNLLYGVKNPSPVARELPGLSGKFFFPSDVPEALRVAKPRFSLTNLPKGVLPSEVAEDTAKAYDNIIRRKGIKEQIDEFGRITFSPTELPERLRESNKYNPVGKLTAEDIKNPMDGEVVLPKNKTLTREILDNLNDAYGIERVNVKDEGWMRIDQVTGRQVENDLSKHIGLSEMMKELSAESRGRITPNIKRVK
jgi:hypothetical protein